MTRRNADPMRQTRPRGVARCRQCGYDHELQEAQAQAWHEQHDPSIGESRDPFTLERLRR